MAIPNISLYDTGSAQDQAVPTDAASSDRPDTAILEERRAAKLAAHRNGTCAPWTNGRLMALGS